MSKGPLVQLAERLPHKQVVPGSSPGRSIVYINKFPGYSLEVGKRIVRAVAWSVRVRHLD